MRSLRRTIQISDGVNVNLLFTPHLFTFEGVQGASFERNHADDESDAQRSAVIFELYADIMFAAALNAWVLDGCGTVEDAPFKRGDFHAFMTADPENFGKALNFALEALTGRPEVERMIDDAAGYQITFEKYPRGNRFPEQLRAAMVEKIRELSR